MAIRPASSNLQELQTPIDLRSVDLLPGGMATRRHYKLGGRHPHETSGMASSRRLLLHFGRLRDVRPIPLLHQIQSRLPTGTGRHSSRRHPIPTGQPRRNSQQTSHHPLFWLQFPLLHTPRKGHAQLLSKYNPHRQQLSPTSISKDRHNAFHAPSCPSTSFSSSACRA